MIVPTLEGNVYTKTGFPLESVIAIVVFALP